MGCGASASGVAHPYIEVDVAWDKVWKTVEKRNEGIEKKLVVKRTGWKTVRVFVSSTFKDFHQEREFLVKKVFPDLRAWCESRRLHLVECDLRWGVPIDATNEITLKMCLSEIDRCYHENIMPFFLNMTSERIGWVPMGHEVPANIRDEYSWIDGLSVTEMEIMHGAYRKDNPNAIFMMRDVSFLDTVPKEQRKMFIDSHPMADYKLQILRKNIKDRFPNTRVKYYHVAYGGFNPHTDLVELDGLDQEFSTHVFDFFKERISKQYPLYEEANMDPFLRVREQHDAFMKNRTESVLGRGDVLSQIDQHICSPGNDVPYVLIGGAGSGKSSIMSRVADEATKKAMNNEIPGGGPDGWHVFYHFVGAVPGSTDLLALLQRLLKELNVVNDTTMPSDVETAAQTARSALANPNTKPVIVIIDALNQMDEDIVSSLATWLPKKLAPQVRCIVSMIPDTAQHKTLREREPLPLIVQVTPLDIKSRRIIVQEMLGKYNKKLDEEQMVCLLCKKSSENPLWLSIACEELRVFGFFMQITDKINQLADSLLELEVQILERFEKENGGDLLVAAVCLLEVSKTGMLETELLTILGNEDNLTPTKKASEGAEKDDSSKESTQKDMVMLPAYKWSEVYRALRPFLRPFGDSGEGRLDFYHRSLSKAVRQKYFSGSNKDVTYQWWHGRLANFFASTSNLDRQIEEYPYHLIATKQIDRLEKFLTRMDVFEALYREDYSAKLYSFWRESKNISRLETCYKEMVQNYENSGKASREELEVFYIKMGTLMGQFGRYEMARGLLVKAFDIEVNEMGDRDIKKVEIFSAIAFILDEEMKKQEYMYASQLPHMRIIMSNYEQAAQIRRTLPGEQNKFRLARVLNRLAFYYSGYAARGGDSHYSETEARRIAFERVEECIELYRELNHDVGVGDAYTTKGVAYGLSCPEQIKIYKEAKEIIVKAAGKYCLQTDRLYLNMAIYYEEMRDYQTAYDYFREWYNCDIELFGRDHPKSARSIKTVREAMYQRIARERGDPIPDPPPAENA